MLLVSQFYFVYWHNTVLVVMTRSASSVDVECMLFITGQILNGKQCSLSPQSADKLSFFTALHGMQSRYSDGNSVCPSVRLSVCPSVKRVNCDKTEESCA